MSEEKTTSDNGSEIDGYFDSLMEEYDKNDDRVVPEEDTTQDVPLDMRDFSKFFEDAAASGSGFKSTVDNSTPVLDEDGMIVIFDADSGIDATDSKKRIEQMRKSISERKAEKEIPVFEEPVAAVSRDIDEDDIEKDIFASTGEIDDSADSNISPEPEGVKELPTEPVYRGEKRPSKKGGGIRGLFPQKGDGVGEVIRKVVFLSASVVFVGAGVVLINTLIQSKQAMDEQQQLIEMITTTAHTTINEKGEVETIPPTTEEREQHNESLMNSFVEVSSDVKGFVELPGCDIYDPVVQGTDNDYYLTHTYDNKTNKAGAVFMDYRCTVSEEFTSPNIVLYGHNQEDGTMFGNLKKYKNDVEFYKENPFVSFNTDNGIGDYVIFGYFITNVYPKQDLYGEVFHYHDYIDALADETTFNWYMEEIAERNQIIPSVDVQFGDPLLVLSTCSTEYADSRFVVIARKLREGETTADIDVSGTVLNPDAKKIDWDAVLYGKTLISTTESTTEETTTTAETTTTTTEPTTTTSEETTTTTVTTTEATTTTTRVTTENRAISELGLVTRVTMPTTTARETTVPETKPETEAETTVPSETSRKKKNTETSPGGFFDPYYEYMGEAPVPETSVPDFAETVETTVAETRATRATTRNKAIDELGLVTRVGQTEPTTTPEMYIYTDEPETTAETAPTLSLATRVNVH